MLRLDKLGIEIRRTGKLDNLYKDVDKVLSHLDIPENGVNGNIQITAVAHALQKMISVQNYFDVCTIDKCSQMCQIVIPKERMQIYNSIHCHHWSEMLPEFRQAVVAMVLDDFRTILNKK